MTLAQVLELVDALPRAEQDVVYQHLQEQRERRVWLVPGENLKAIDGIFAPLHAVTDTMSEDEVFAVFDEALAQVRRDAANHRD